MMVGLAVIGGLILGGLGVLLSSLVASRRRDVRLSAELRELLTARAAGKVSEEEFGRRQAAVHAALLESAPAARGKRWWWAVPAAVVGATLGFYLSHGSPYRFDVQPEGPLGTRFGNGAAPTPSPGPTGAQANSGGDLNTMAKRLADKLAKDPRNGEGWLLLARTYNELRQPQQAAGAFAKAAALTSLDASTLADWADAQVMANGRKWDAEARKIVRRALEADPKHVKALALAGSEAFDRADYREAIGYWKRMAAVAPAGSMDVKLAEANIQEAEAMLGGKKPGAAAASPAPVTTAGISGTVTLDPGLKGKVAPTDTVFVVAKAPDGSGPPLAVQRFSAAELPLQFKLDDAAAMVPGRTLSQFGAAIVSARVSKTGNALPGPGDIDAAATTAKVGATRVDLRLTTVR
jgi:cytochrome c-type biogenesis protein CcmH